MDGETLSQATPPVLYHALDPRVVKLWKIHSLIATAVLLGMAAAAVLILDFASRRGIGPWPWLVWLALAGLRGYFFFWHQQRAYRNWGYRLDGKVLETKHGIWFRQLQLLPLARLQHVDLHSGPIERSLGLASLLLHTAGTHEATIAIPGLDTNEAARLRDHLVLVGGDDGV